MPLHPFFEAFAQNAQAQPTPTDEAERVAQSRMGYDMLGALGGELAAPGEVRDLTAPGPAGDIPVRVYRPATRGPHPVLVYYHGGGFAIGSLQSHDPVCRFLCTEADALVVASEYRLAPENPFPASHDDAFAVLQWVAENAASLGGDPERIAVGGDSAGGNLAATAAIHARDNGGPPLAFQLLLNPTVDATLRFPSIEENAGAPVLGKETMEWFFSLYQGDPSDWRLTPIDLDDHSGLPPALIVTAEYDPLRDEGEAYGEALRAAGVPVTVRRYDGMAHVFFQFISLVEPATEALGESAAALRTAFATSPSRF